MKRRQLKSTGVFALAIAMVLSCFSVALAVQPDAAMSYETYFSQDRKFELPTTIDALDEYYVFIAGPDAYTDCTGLTEGALYKRSWTDSSTELLVEAPVVAVRFCGDRIYYSNGISIISINIDGTDGKTVFADESGIGFFTPSADVIFYEQGNRLMRLYRATGKVDDVCSLEHITWYQPLTNNSLSITTDGSLCPEIEMTMKETDILTLSLDTGAYTITPAQDADVGTDIVIEDDIMPLASFVSRSYTINGKSVPVKIPALVGNTAKIDNGKYRSDGAKFKPVTSTDKGTYFCKDHTKIWNESSNPSMNYNGSEECAGFALYVYSEIWGSNAIKEHHRHYFSSTEVGLTRDLTETDCKAFYQQVAPGALVRGGGGSQGKHSFIFLGINSTGTKMVVYDANRTDTTTCIIRMTELSFSEAASHGTIGNIHNVCMPMWYTNEGHYFCCENKCTEVSGGGGFQPHYINGYPGYGTCEVCGYTGYISTGTLSVGGGEVESK